MRTAHPIFTLVGRIATAPVVVQRRGSPHVEFRLRPWSRLAVEPQSRKPSRENLVVVRGDHAATCLRLLHPGRIVVVEGTIHHRVEDPRGKRRLVTEFHARAVALAFRLGGSGSHARPSPVRNSRP
ncbi:MAG: hypothetical protein DIJKHBIC_02304 [Thermoanaerobaculia bacterium]|nr:hypothetical protein [Thermoanaerobaculia bacterium]